MKRTLILGAIVVLLWQCFGGTATAQLQEGSERKVGRASDRVRLTIESKVRKVHRGDSFLVKMKIINEGKKPISLFKHLGFGISGIGIVVTDSDRKPLFPVIYKERFPPEPPYSPDDFLTIHAESTFEQDITIFLDEYQIERAGHYELRILFRSPVPKDFVPRGLDAITSEVAFESNIVKFEIAD